MPVYAYDRMKVVVYGDMITVQSWSFGLDFTFLASGATQAQLQAWTDAARAALTTWAAASNSFQTNNPSDVRILGIKGYIYHAGTSAAAFQSLSNLVTPLAGGSVSITASQISIVQSKQTGTPGRHYRGRMYVPLTGVAMTTGHKIPSGICTGQSTATRALINAWNAIALAGNSVQAIVASRTPLPLPIRQISTDNDPDVQRRRSDKLLPSFVQTDPIP